MPYRYRILIVDNLVTKAQMRGSPVIQDLKCQAHNKTTGFPLFCRLHFAVVSGHMGVNGQALLDNFTDADFGVRQRSFILTERRENLPDSSVFS